MTTEWLQSWNDSMGQQIPCTEIPKHLILPFKTKREFISIHISNLTDIILTMSFMGSFCTTSFRVRTIVQFFRPRLPSITEFQYFVKEISLLLLKILSNLGQNTEICHNFAINFTQNTEICVKMGENGEIPTICL